MKTSIDERRIRSARVNVRCLVTCTSLGLLAFVKKRKKARVGLMVKLFPIDCLCCPASSDGVAALRGLPGAVTAPFESSTEIALQNGYAPSRSQSNLPARALTALDGVRGGVGGFVLLRFITG